MLHAQLLIQFVLLEDRGPETARAAPAAHPSASQHSQLNHGNDGLLKTELCRKNSGGQSRRKLETETVVPKP